MTAPRSHGATSQLAVRHERRMPERSTSTGFMPPKASRVRAAHWDRAHCMYDVGRVVDDTADAWGVPAVTFAIPLAFAHHDVDLLGRMLVLDISHVGRNQTCAEPHVAPLFQPHRPDDVRIGVAFMKRLAVRLRAGTPAPSQLGLQHLESFREGRDLQRRPCSFERGEKVDDTRGVERGYPVRWCQRRSRGLRRHARRPRREEYVPRRASRGYLWRHREIAREPRNVSLKKTSVPSQSTTPTGLRNLLRRLFSGGA